MAISRRSVQERGTPGLEDHRRQFTADEVIAVIGRLKATAASTT
jgi:hypothetical protein